MKLKSRVVSSQNRVGLILLTCLMSSCATGVRTWIKPSDGHQNRFQVGTSQCDGFLSEQECIDLRMPEINKAAVSACSVQPERIFGCTRSGWSARIWCQVLCSNENDGKSTEDVKVTSKDDKK